MEPVAERPGIDESYGIASDSHGLLSWNYLIREVERSRSYWVVSVRPDGRPHAMPVWGVWAADALRFSTGSESVKARNIAADPRVVVHLESGDDAVILEGVAERPTLDAATHAQVVDAYAGKYDIRPEDLPGPDGWYTLRATRVLAWRESDFPHTATRWRLS